jgi:hypothetical protein
MSAACPHAAGWNIGPLVTRPSCPVEGSKRVQMRSSSVVRGREWPRAVTRHSSGSKPAGACDTVGGGVHPPIASASSARPLTCDFLPALRIPFSAQTPVQPRQRSRQPVIISRRTTACSTNKEYHGCDKHTYKKSNAICILMQRDSNWAGM